MGIVTRGKLMTVHLRSTRSYARAAESLSTSAVTSGARGVTPGHWELLNTYGERIAVAKVRRAEGQAGAAGWIESWSIVRRSAVRHPLGTRTLRYIGTRPVSVPAAEATIWAAATVTEPPSPDAARGLSRPREVEGQLWLVRQQRGSQPAVCCGWLLREILPETDGSERWMDHWILFAHHQHPSPGLSWQLRPMGRTDLPTFLGRLGHSTGEGPSRSYVQASYTLPPRRARPPRTVALEIL
jgi:hypothetical protein